MQNAMKTQYSSRKVHADDADSEEVFDVRLPETLPPGVTLAGFGPRGKHESSGPSTAMAAAKKELARRKQRIAGRNRACKCCSAFFGGSSVLAGFILIVVSLVDLVTLAPTEQASCRIDGFEYPGGYPTIVDPKNTNPCPEEPACLFQVRSSVEGGRIVRHWNVPFKVPEMKAPAEDYHVHPPHESLSCCPLTPGSCCGWYDKNTTAFCDQSKTPNCPQAPWPCYFEKVKFHNDDEQAGQLDGSYMKVGDKLRSLPTFFAGVALFGSGMLILTFWIKRIRETCWGRVDALTSWLDFKIWIWTLKAIKRVPRWMLTEDIVDWWREETSKILFVQRCIRNWLERKRNKNNFVLAKGVALWQNEAINNRYELDRSKNAKRITTFVPTEKEEEQEVNQSSSDPSPTEKQRKRKKGSNSTGSSESQSIATSASSEQGAASQQKTGSSKETAKPGSSKETTKAENLTKEPAKAGATSGRQVSQDETLSEPSTTLRPEEVVSERAEAQGHELVDNMLPKATKKSKSRKLLYDSGNMHDFKRLSRVRVVSEPWERLCVEVALEEGAPQFGAFVRVVELSAGEAPRPPVVSRVKKCSMASENGVLPGFELLKVNRLEWPNFPAEEMVTELQSGRRPLFLVLQEPETRATRERARLVQAGYTSPPMPAQRPSSASRPLPPGTPSSAPSAPEVAPPSMPSDDLEAAALALPGETSAPQLPGDAAAPQFDSAMQEFRNSNGSVRPTAQLPRRPHSAGNHASNMRIAEAARDRRRPMSAAAAGGASRDSGLSRAQTWQPQRQLSLDSNSSGPAANPSRPSSSTGRMGHGGGSGAAPSSQQQQRRPSGMSHGSGSNAGRRSRPGSAASAVSSSRVAQGTRGPSEGLRPASAGSSSSKQPDVIGRRGSDQGQQQQRKRPSSAAATMSRPPSGMPDSDRQLARRKTVETSEALGNLLGF